MFCKSNNDNDKVKKLDNKIILVEVNMANRELNLKTCPTTGLSTSISTNLLS